MFQFRFFTSVILLIIIAAELQETKENVIGQQI